MTLRLTTLPPLLLAALLAAAGAATAHTHVKTADGKYDLTIGWKTEPPYAGLKNGLDLRIQEIVEGHEDDHGTEHGHGAAGKRDVTTGVIGNLTVTYEIAGKTFTPPDFRAQHGRPGWYTAEITPTREGEYTIHLVGTLNATAIDLRVKPHAIESVADTMFPEPDLTPEETTTKIAALEKQVSDLKAEIASLKTTAQNEKPPVTDVKNRTPAPGIAFAALAAAGVALALRRPA